MQLDTRIKAIEEKIDNLSTELRTEFKAEIKGIHKDLLKIANRPINISNQIRIGSDNLENKIIEILDELTSQIKSKKKLKNQLEGIKETIKKSPKYQEAQNKIKKFFKEIGDYNRATALKKLTTLSPSPLAGEGGGEGYK
jgi:hypothetical protein